MPGVTRWWRIRAALVDLALAAAWAVLVAAVTLPLYATGSIPGLSPLRALIAGSALVIVPIIIALGVLEGGRYEASLGKQWLGLRVRRSDGSRLGLGRSLLRNTVKAGPPWLLGCAALMVWASAVPPVGTDVWILTATAVLVPLGYLLAALSGHGRGPHDVVTDSVVVATTPGRRVAHD